MALITVTRRFEFDTGHRVLGHEFKCKYVHGHRYQCEAEFTIPQLDSLGRVIDFGVIKQRLGNWFNEYWDHNVVLWSEDRALGQAIAAQTGQSIYYLPSNPTAENMAFYLLETICPKLFAGLGVTCTKINLYETPNCSATARHVILGSTERS